MKGDCYFWRRKHGALGGKGRVAICVMCTFIQYSVYYSVINRSIFLRMYYALGEVGVGWMGQREGQ